MVETGLLPPQASTEKSSSVSTASARADHDPEGPHDSIGLANPCHRTAWPKARPKRAGEPASPTTSGTRTCDEAADVTIDLPRRGVTTPSWRTGPRQSRERVNAPPPLSQTRATAGHRVGIDSRLRAIPCGASPSGGFPSPVAVPRHRGPCPRVVRSSPHPHRVTAAGTIDHPRPQGFVPLPSPWRLPGVATRPRSILPWACVPDRNRSGSESSAA